MGVSNWWPARRRVFVSYRRAFGGEEAFDFGNRLGQKLGERRVKFDHDALGAGERYEPKLLEYASNADVVAVVIAPGWVTARDEAGNPRLHDEDDLHRREIETGLTHAGLVIPVLVNGAKMPDADELPPSLRPLCDYNAKTLPGETTEFYRVAASLADEIQRRWRRRTLVWAAAVTGLAAAIGIPAALALGGGDGTDAAATTTPPATTTAAESDPVGAPETLATTTTTTAADTTLAAPSVAPPQLAVTLIRAFNGDPAAEQSAIQTLVANRGDVAVNVDRATFTVTKIGRADCTLLPATGGSPGTLVARGADLEAYSVPVYEYSENDDDVVRVTLNPPRRFEADGEETLLRFDLDETTLALGQTGSPPYVDERYYFDGVEEIGFRVFEIQVALETTMGDTVEAGTVAVAHPRLMADLVTGDAISDACGWDVGVVSIDDDDLTSVRLKENRDQMARFCDSPTVRGLIGGNEDLDALLRNEIGCD